MKNFTFGCPLMAGVFFLAFTAALNGFAHNTKYTNKPVATLPPQQLEVTDSTIVEVEPQFPDGDSALLAFVKMNLKYTSVALEKGIEGTVMVNFMVGKDGSVSDVNVTKGLMPECDSAAVAVVRKLPRFRPAKHNGRPVESWFNLPLSFRIQKNTQQAGGTTVPPKEPEVMDNAIVVVEAQFPGGWSALYDFVKANLKYPSVALKNRDEGTVMLKIKVGKDGSVSDVKITKGLTHECDSAAFAVVSQLPRFRPAKHNGRPVAVWFNIPIRFRIPKDNQQACVTTLQPKETEVTDIAS